MFATILRQLSSPKKKKIRFYAFFLETALEEMVFEVRLSDKNNANFDLDE